MTQNGSGIITSRTKGFYYLNTDEGESIECKIKGNFFKDSKFNNQVAVGDKVNFTFANNDKIGMITEISPRKSFLSRCRVGIQAEQVIVANVDNLFIISSIINPPFRNNFIFRLLVAAYVGDITPILIVTKTDLVKKDEIASIIKPFHDLGFKIILSSINEKESHTEIQRLLTNKISVLVGHSGVGKSTLINKLFPDLKIKVSDINQKTLRGTHTTTYAKMYSIKKNSYVIDTPGVREFGFWNLSKDELKDYYPGLMDFQGICKLRDCQHIHEPKCKVKDAVQQNNISQIAYQGYISIYNSLK